MSVTNLRNRYFRLICQDAAIKLESGDGLYVLRRAAISHLADQGVNPEVISKMVGASAGTIWKHYVKVLPGRQKAAAETLARMLRE